MNDVSATSARCSSSTLAFTRKLSSRQRTLRDVIRFEDTRFFSRLRIEPQYYARPYSFVASYRRSRGEVTVYTWIRPAPRRDIRRGKWKCIDRSLEIAADLRSIHGSVHEGTNNCCRQLCSKLNNEEESLTRTMSHTPRDILFTKS